MTTIYKILIAIIFLYAIGHMAYTFTYLEANNTEQKLWFFSGGIAMLSLGFMNYLNLRIKNSTLRTLCSIMNLFFLIFIIILSFVLLEIQVYILAIILLAILFVGLQKSIIRVKETVEKTKYNDLVNH